jgi:hypothetical protein
MFANTLLWKRVRRFVIFYRRKLLRFLLSIFRVSNASKFESEYGGFEEKEYNNVYRYLQWNEYLDDIMAMANNRKMTTVKTNFRRKCAIFVIIENRLQYRVIVCCCSLWSILNTRTVQRLKVIEESEKHRKVLWKNEVDVVLNSLHLERSHFGINSV